MRKQRHSFILVFLVFLLFSFFRFYNLDKRVIFDWDQERDALVIERILSGKLTLIGPRALGPEGFFLGPYFTYLLAPFYLLTKLHPGAMVFFIIVYNLAFFALTFLVLREFFGYSTALIFLLIWSLHPALIGIDLIAWNPLLVPLVVIAIWGLFFLTFRKLPLYIWLAVGILVGLGINFHFQLLFLTPFALVFLFSQRKDLIKRLAVFLGGIAFCFLPLLAFDLRHNFLNSKLFLDFLSGEGKGVDYFAWFPVWKNVTVALIGIDAKIIPLAFYFLVLVLVILGWKKEKKREHRHFFLAFLLLWLFFPFGFSIFGRRPSEYYFNFLRPFLVFLFTYFLLKVIKNWQIVFLLVLLSFFPKVDQLKEGLQPNPLGLFYKEKVVQRISDIGRGRKFNVSFSVPLGLDTGYRYLLEFYQIKQTQNPDDPLFQIVIPPQEGTEVIGGIGLQVPGSFQE